MVIARAEDGTCCACLRLKGGGDLCGDLCTGGLCVLDVLGDVPSIWSCQSSSQQNTCEASCSPASQEMVWTCVSARAGRPQILRPSEARGCSRR